MKSILNFITESATTLEPDSTYQFGYSNLWMSGYYDEQRRKYFIQFCTTKEDAIQNLAYIIKDKAKTLAAKVNKTGDYAEETIDSEKYVFAKIL